LIRSARFALNTRVDRLQAGLLAHQRRNESIRRSSQRIRGCLEDILDGRQTGHSSTILHLAGAWTRRRSCDDRRH
jgi:hypothetical protein